MQPGKANEATFPQMKTVPAEHQPSISLSQGKKLFQNITATDLHLW